MTILRIWRRDRSTNEMTLEVAAANLRSVNEDPHGDYAGMLSRGQVCETEHALFVRSDLAWAAERMLEAELAGELAG